MVEYSASDGTPFVLGNIVIEGITGNGTVVASSCIGCHVYASFGPREGFATRSPGRRSRCRSDQVRAKEHLDLLCKSQIETIVRGVRGDAFDRTHGDEGGQR